MTDAFEVTGAFAPAEISTNTTFASDAVITADVSSDMAMSEVSDVPEAPNGFVLLGLAPELVAAVKDLGYTQPTTVQLKTIPLALPSDGADQQAKKYIDLMVSSQTGSGKTAAFLLPVLHTLLKQLAQADNRAPVVAQVMYYLRRLKFGESKKAIPPSFCIADKTACAIGDVADWKALFTDTAERFDWDLRPSSPDPLLVAAVQKHPAFKKLHPRELHIAEEDKAHLASWHAC